MNYEIRVEHRSDVTSIIERVGVILRFILPDDEDVDILKKLIDVFLEFHWLDDAHDGGSHNKLKIDVKTKNDTKVSTEESYPYDMFVEFGDYARALISGFYVEDAPAIQIKFECDDNETFKNLSMNWENDAVLIRKI